MKTIWNSLLVLTLLLSGCAEESENTNPFANQGSNSVNSMANGDGTSQVVTGGEASNERVEGEENAEGVVQTEGGLVGEETPDSGTDEDLDAVAGSDVGEDATGGGEEDIEQEAECEAAVDCPEADPCQTVACVGNSCVYDVVDDESSCDDGDPCTGGDICVSGLCTGFDLDCDDDNPCTNDSCVNGCAHTPVDTPECTLTVTFIDPTRGDLLYGNPSITVTGEVYSPASVVDSAVLNGEPLTLDSDGRFERDIVANVGVNMLKLEASNQAGQLASSAISFAYGDGIHEIGDPYDVNRLVSGTGAWLGEVNFDDGNDDLDDLSSLAVFVLDNLDINSVIPHPLLAEGDGPGALWCEWEVDIETTGSKQITYDLEDVSVKPMDGGFRITGQLSNFKSWVEAEADGFGCPDGKGWLTASAVEIDVEATAQITTDGAVDIIIKSAVVTITDTEVDIQEGFGAWVNWLIDWFEDDLENIVEDELASFIPSDVVPLIETALNEVAHVDESFILPALPGGVDLPLTISVIAAGAQFSPAGVEFALSAGIAVEPFVDVELPGSLARGTCGGGGGGVNPVVGPIPGGGGNNGGGNNNGGVGEGPCCDAEIAPGCEDAVCESCVCSQDSYCCENAWDFVCAVKASDDCSASCGCNDVSTFSVQAEDSCEGACGENPGLCWCDELCIVTGDCCSDACEVCGFCEEGETGGGPTVSSTAYVFEKEYPIEVRIHEDMLNHILHGAWLGGYLNLDLDPIVFEEIISVLGATNMTMTVYPLMPPMVTTCTDDGELEVHVGSILCDAKFTFNGVPAAFKLFADIQTEIELTTVNNIEGTSEIGVMLKELESYQVDVLDTVGLGSLGDLLVNAVLTDAIVQLLVADVLNNLIATYPVPTLDLHSIVPSIPPGNLMTGDFYDVGWSSGHFEAGGAIYGIDE